MVPFPSIPPGVPVKTTGEALSMDLNASARNGGACALTGSDGSDVMHRRPQFSDRCSGELAYHLVRGEHAAGEEAKIRKGRLVAIA